MTKKNIIFLSISLVLIILLGIGVSYSMWNVSVSQDTNNTAYTECFDLSINNKENNISLDNAYPISNDKGKSLTPYTFTITNTCDITAQYNINLEVLKDSTLSSKFIDVMFEGNINLLSSYDSTDKVNASSIESRKLTYGILKSRESKDYSLRLWIDYNTTLEDLNNEIKNFKSKIVVVGKPINYTGDTVFNFDYTGGEQTFIAPVSGTYKVELWGASGNDKATWDTADNFSVLRNSYGLGGYTNGKIFLNNYTNFFVYVGGKNAYNGGGNGEAQGGGASDIRVENDNLYSRIIVAGGGGGGLFGDGSTLIRRGNAGGLVGFDADSTIDPGRTLVGYTTGFSGHGGTQYFGGKTGENGYDNYNESMNGSFGQGGEYLNTGSLDYRASGGGGGWYGGGHGRHPGGTWPGGGGGSSYISGHQGCLAVSSNSSTSLKNGCTKDSNSLECSISYTGYYFTNTLMIDGEGYRWTDKKEEQIGMPSHSDNSVIMGNSGNGYARITLVSIDE